MREVEGRCVAEDDSCGVGAHLEDGACVPNPEGPTCGAGTELIDGECVAIGPIEPIACGPGTERIDDTCVPTDSPVVCGEGTELVDGECVEVEGRVECGSGTHEEDGQCVADNEEAVCGEGMDHVEGVCVPKCDPGEMRNEVGSCECVLGKERVEGVCVDACDSAQERVEGVCVDACGSAQERVEGVCVPRCGAEEIHNGAGDCVCAQGYVSSPMGCAPPGYAFIPAGSFMMGSPESEVGRYSNEDPQHQVTLTRAFWMKTTTVTTGEWFAAIGNWPSDFAQACGENCPVEQVNWYEAVAYANKLSERERLEQCYILQECSGVLGAGSGVNYTCVDVHLNRGCTGYRLPTEAEWEYAYRAGTTGPYYAQPPEDIAWYAESSGTSTHPVGQKIPNAWGLYDMAGNVWEMVWDWYGNYTPDAKIDPYGPVSGTNHALRGGSKSNGPMNIRAASRYAAHPTVRKNLHGFRLARTVP